MGFWGPGMRHKNCGGEVVDISFHDETTDTGYELYKCLDCGWEGSIVEVDFEEEEYNYPKEDV